LQQGAWQGSSLLMNEDQSKGLGATWQKGVSYKPCWQLQPMEKMLEALDSASAKNKSPMASVHSMFVSTTPWQDNQCIVLMSNISNMLISVRATL